MKNESSLLYTRHSDIHSVGIVLLQMLLGLDATDRYADVFSALHACAAYLPFRWEAALDWKDANPKGTMQDFNNFWESVQRDRGKLQVPLILL